MRACCSVLLLLLALPAAADTDTWRIADRVLDNALLTAYWTADETFAVAPKEAVYDRHGILLGHYRADFLDAVRLEGWGRGDGNGNTGDFLGHYRPRGFYRHAYPLDSRNGELAAWQTVAAGRNIPVGTRLRILALPPGQPRDPQVRERLLATEFVVRDRGSWLKPWQFDLYVGNQYAPEMKKMPESFRIDCAVVALDFPD